MEFQTMAKTQGKFQSTRPVWGATLGKHDSRACDTISIHAPRVGRDLSDARLFYNHDLFQSTRPVWGATQACLTLM